MPLTPEQKKARESAIGSSDISGLVLGQDAITLYARLTGEGVEDIDNAQTERGNYLEPVVADWFAAQGFTVTPGTLERHPHWQYEIANLDRWATTAIGRVPLEIKTASGAVAHQWGEEGTDQIPLNYILQVQWQLWVTRKPVAHVAALLGGNEFAFRSYRVRADAELQDMLHTAATAFMANHVTPRIPPPPTGGPKYDTWLRKKYPKSTDLWLSGTEDLNERVALYQSLRDSLDERSQAVEAEKQYLISAIADAAGIEGPDYRLSYKASKDSRRWDLERLEKDHPELVETYTRMAPGSRRFLLNWKKAPK